MSGPKVVRVVTKAEMITAGQRQIESVQDLIAKWTKFADKHNLCIEKEKSEIQTQLVEIKKLFEQEKFRDVQKNCDATRVILEIDINRLRDKAIEKIELERTKRIRLKYAAETLINQLENKKCPVPKELSHIAKSALTGNESQLTEFSNTLSQMLIKHLSEDTNTDVVNVEQQKLAEQLLSGEVSQNLKDWTENYLQETASKSSLHLNRLLSELSLADNSGSIQIFLDRADAIENERSFNRRSLLIDSLIMDVTSYLHKQKEFEQNMGLLKQVYRELTCLKSIKAEELMVLISNALKSEDISSFKIHYEKACIHINEESKNLIAKARREAILQGLSDLGYEINETMATAWAQNGRVVVKKSDENIYGVELGATSDAEKVQIQLVSFEQTTDTLKAAEDLKKEKEWCNEFSHLRSQLGQSGTNVIIEKALPVGSKKLKFVQNSTEISSDSRRKINPLIQKRTQD